MNENPLPDLDNDTLSYRFPKAGSKGFTNIYNIERSINGEYFHIIGTVRKTVEADWSRSAYWSATALDGQSAGGDSRKRAVSALEERLQGPEYSERKRAEWQREHDEQHRRVAEAETKAAERVKIFVRTTWDEPSVVVVLNHVAVATFRVTKDSEGWEHVTLLSPEQATNAATDLADRLRRDIISAELA
jgi:surface antigen